MGTRRQNGAKARQEEWDVLGLGSLGKDRAPDEQVYRDHRPCL